MTPDVAIAVGGLMAALLGAATLVLSAWGLVVLPDALARQHAATKAATLAVGLVAIGAAASGASPAWLWRLALLVLLLVATLPLASQLLARAALRESGRRAEPPHAEVGGDAADPPAFTARAPAPAPSTGPTTSRRRGRTSGSP
jgi:multicomponent Na+:H+ antiporter subunit G